MSESDDGPGTREVAVRLFAAEYDDADRSYSESDEERAPNYVVTPTGARVNRLFAVGVLTEVEPVNEEMLRARVVDPTGAFVVYAGQYQPDALAFLERTDPPAFVAVTGKARTFEPEDGDQVYTSVRPESINEVGADTRDRWVVGTAERTLGRIETVAGALASDARGADLETELRERGVPESQAAGIPRAIDHYGTTPTYLAAVRDLTLDALRVVAGEREEAGRLTTSPDQPGDTTPADLTDVSAAVSAADESVAAETDAAASTGSLTEEPPSGADEAAEPAEAAGVGTETTEAEASGDPEPEPTDETAAAGTDAAASTGSLTEEPPATEAGAAEPAEAAGPSETSPGEAGEEDLGDFDSEFELDEEERKEVEEEFGTEFETATEVEDPGEAGIEPEAPQPDPEAETAEAAGEPEAEDAGEAEAEEPAAEAGGEEPSTGAEGESEPEAEAIDLEDAVMAVMEDLDEGEGIEREAVVAAVVDEHDAEPDAVEDAIQDALMSGRCYEPAEETLKPI